MIDSLTRFANEQGIDAQALALTEIIKAKSLHRVAKEPAFLVGIELLMHHVEGASDADQLFAFALLSKIAYLVSELRVPVRDGLNSRLDAALADARILPDADDRLYVAKGCQLIAKPWVAQYAASAAVKEESADKARSEALRCLLDSSQDLACALVALCDPVRRLSFDTRKPGDSMAKRMHRVLATLREAYVVRPIDAGPSAGESLAALARECTRRFGEPETNRHRDEISNDFLLLGHEIVRTKFSLATESSTYSVLQDLRGWYREDSWREYVEASPAAQQLASDIEQAIRLLLRTGVADDALLDRLVLAVGGRELLRPITQRIVDELPGLTDELTAWILGRPIPKHSFLATESQLQSLDQVLGELLLEARQVRTSLDLTGNRLVAELEMLAPRLVGDLRNVTTSVEAMLNALDLVGIKRSIEVFGEESEIVEFDPRLHRFEGVPSPGSRSVRILRVGIRTKADDPFGRIVCKAVVQPA